MEYTPIPERARQAMAAEGGDREAMRQAVAAFANVEPRSEDRDGDVETLDGVQMTHRFAETPGDSEMVRWHYVETGPRDGEPVVFLHGVPESWFMWHRQMAALAPHWRVLSVDLKGYGQSDKKTGDYRQEGVAEQLLALFDVLKLDRTNLVTHDRGSVIADYLGANHPERVLRYLRGEQHLYHFHPDLAPQELLFTDPERVGILRQPRRLVPSAYLGLAAKPVDHADIVRSVQEFSYPRIGWAVPRYFNSSSFRKEWLDRRTRLMAAWQFPVLVLQGALDPRQPREFYEGIEAQLPNVRVRFIDAGHFFVFENPTETTAAIEEFLETPL
ncbi:MAG: alpha/beta fold hydrolase [Dehalococcoidia bacterium]